MELPIPLITNSALLTGNLTILSNAKALIIFAHGSGSGKTRPRDEYVSIILNENGFATLLVDLLTPEDQETDVRRENNL